MFYSSTYAYKFILDLFDCTDGLRRVVNIASTSIADGESDTEEQDQETLLLPSRLHEHLPDC